MSIQRNEVESIALLARLLFTEPELAKMTGELGSILEYIELLEEVDTTGIEPMAHAIDSSNVFRDDRRSESLPRDAALANAPKRDQECFLVPAVLTGGGDA
jgi:aspartyl-tRNA(Asn)/glutamyl-tRNA(Gln) amidotransferase subunit C